MEWNEMEAEDFHSLASMDTWQPTFQDKQQEEAPPSRGCAWTPSNAPGPKPRLLRAFLPGRRVDFLDGSEHRNEGCEEGRHNGAVKALWRPLDCTQGTDVLDNLPHALWLDAMAAVAGGGDVSWDAWARALRLCGQDVTRALALYCRAVHPQMEWRVTEARAAPVSLSVRTDELLARATEALLLCEDSVAGSYAWRVSPEGAAPPLPGPVRVTPWTAFFEGVLCKRLEGDARMRINETLRYMRTLQPRGMMYCLARTEASAHAFGTEDGIETFRPKRTTTPSCQESERPVGMKRKRATGPAVEGARRKVACRQRGLTTDMCAFQAPQSSRDLLEEACVLDEQEGEPWLRVALARVARSMAQDACAALAPDMDVFLVCADDVSAAAAEAEAGPPSPRPHDASAWRLALALASLLRRVTGVETTAVWADDARRRRVKVLVHEGLTHGKTTDEGTRGPLAVALFRSDESYATFSAVTPASRGSGPPVTFWSDWWDEAIVGASYFVVAADEPLPCNTHDAAFAAAATGMPIVGRRKGPSEGRRAVRCAKDGGVTLHMYARPSSAHMPSPRRWEGVRKDLTASVLFLANAFADAGDDADRYLDGMDLDAAVERFRAARGEYPSGPRAAPALAEYLLNMAGQCVALTTAREQADALTEPLRRGLIDRLWLWRTERDDDDNDAEDAGAVLIRLDDRGGWARIDGHGELHGVSEDEVLWGLNGTNQSMTYILHDLGVMSLLAQALREACPRFVRRGRLVRGLYEDLALATACARDDLTRRSILASATTAALLTGRRRTGCGVPDVERGVATQAVLMFAALMLRAARRAGMDAGLLVEGQGRDALAESAAGVERALSAVERAVKVRARDATLRVSVKTGSGRAARAASRWWRRPPGQEGVGLPILLF